MSLQPSHDSVQMRVLLLGAHGMLGRAWTQLLVAESIEHEAHDRDTLDMLDPHAVAAALDRYAPTHVVNAAAWTDVDGAEASEPEADELNAAAVGVLGLLCADRDIELVHYSTDYVFGGNATAPYPVDGLRAPLNAYGRTKARGEEAIIESGCTHLIVRTSWLYAPWAKNFVLSIARLAAERDTLSVVDDQRGRPTSSTELARNTLGLLRAGETGLAHLTDDGECTWYEFATEIAKLTNSGCDVQPCTSDAFPRPAKRPAYSVLDISRSRTILASVGVTIADWRESVRAALAEAGYTSVHH
jgi:dTDP-4-dehydrorhamnose reductase